jgi:putative ABC transport system substrate-binding protein
MVGSGNSSGILAAATVEVNKVRRRQFLSFICGVTVVPSVLPPAGTRAQQATKLPVIGFLGTTPSAWAHNIAAFSHRLGELGWTEGRTVAIEYRWAEGRNDRVADIAAEFVQRKVDVILTTGGAVSILKQSTAVISIVFAIANDPVGSGFVKSLARPGGNVTGLSLQAPDLAGKRLELLSEVVPSLHRLEIMANVGYSAARLEMDAVGTTARALGLAVSTSEIRRAEDIIPAFEALKGRADALYVVAEPLISSNRTPINTLAIAARLPTMHGVRDYVEAGGLISYGPNFQDLFRRAAEYVDKILRGTKPGEIPVEQPTKFDLVVNLKTARAIGLTIPPVVLARADEVFE